MPKRKPQTEIEKYTPRIIETVEGIAKPVPCEDLGRFHEHLARMFGGNETVNLIATILVDGGEEIELKGGDLEELWEQLLDKIGGTDLNWWAVEVRNKNDKKKFKFERPANSRITARRVTDGLTSWNEVSMPIPKGDSVKIVESDLASTLDQIEENLRSDGVPGIVFEDSFYSPKELSNKGVASIDTWEKHLEETENEVRVRAWVKTEDGSIDEKIFTTEKDALLWLEHQDETEKGKILEGEFEHLERKFGPQFHPLKIAACRVLGHLTKLREKIPDNSQEGPFMEGLEEGLRLGLSFAEFQKVRATPLGTFKHDMTQKKGSPHKKTKADVQNQIDYLRKWLSNHKNSEGSYEEIYRRYFRQASKKSDLFIVNPKGAIRHKADKKSIARSTLTKKRIPEIRKELGL